MEPEIAIYPNPISGNFYIDLGKSYPDVSVQVHDIQEKLVYSERVNEGKLLTIDLAKKAKGMYTVTITSSGRPSVHLLGVE